MLLAQMPAAQAGLVTWTLSNVQFDDGGSVSGYFQFDAVNLTVANYNLVTTGGNATNFPGLTYSSTTKTVDPYYNGFGGLASISFYDVAPNNTVGGGAYRSLILEFNGLLTNLGGSFSVDAGALSSGSIECYNCNPNRKVVSGGSITGVPVAEVDPSSSTPEPGTLGLITAGSIAAFVLRRRRS